LFLHADHADATFKNENTWIGLEEVESPYRRMVCRQVSGMVARNIVCDLRPGEVLDRGAKFGMIKFGSRTELIVPAEGLKVNAQVGQWVKAGRDVLAQYSDRGISS
jgi:phosphatidylserine decarboxylase